jgi:amidase
MEVGADPGTLRVGYSTQSIFGKNTDPACVEAVTRTVELLRGLGHQVEEAELPVDSDRLAHAYLVQVGVGVSGEIAEMARWTGRRPHPGAFEAGTWFLKQVGDTLSAMDLLHARDAAMEATRQMAGFHERYDLFLGPTLAHPPVRLGALQPSTVERVGLGLLRLAPLKPLIRAILAQLAANNFEPTPNTQLFNQTGAPAISLPIHMAGGLPIGIQLAAGHGGEATLIRVAAQLEAAAPWDDRVPPVHA